MQILFRLGPAGSGKTHRCLAEVRAALGVEADGLPLIVLAPKQATFQIERQLLASPSLPGYTRLRILSFERLAHFLLEQLGQPVPEMLNEQGRLMVLRSLLAKSRDRLKLYRASARMTGFARELSEALRELQQHQLTPETLVQLAGALTGNPGLSLKMQDLATMLQAYTDWLEARSLRDVESLLAFATQALLSDTDHRSVRIAALWLDGFAEFTPSQLDFLAAIIARCERATIALCLDPNTGPEISWVSPWSLVRRTFDAVRQRLLAAGAAIEIESLPRVPAENRFDGNPVLQHLEACWSDPKPYAAPERTPAVADVSSRLRAAMCVNPEAEAALAAAEILRFVRGGGRYREASVIVRRLETYQAVLQRVFARCAISFFLDRREPMAHHPMAELTRSALRTAALGWQHNDWFAALKTGLAPAADEEIDWLENEALARGWNGATWQHPIGLEGDPELSRRIEALRRQIVPPFQKLALRLGEPQHRLAGPELAGPLREFWRELEVQRQLVTWSDAGLPDSGFEASASVHTTVWDEMNDWLQNIESAFDQEPFTIREWLPIVDAGLANLTVGVIPPALDQVLIGAVDRTRNPEVKLAIVLGLNEGTFPALPETPALLTDSDLEELECRNLRIGSTGRRQFSREQYLAYIAFTRPRQRLVLTCSAVDANERPLNPSPFLSRIRQLFPTLAWETPPRAPDWPECEHASDLIAPLVRMQNENPAAATEPGPAALLREVPALAAALARIERFHNPRPDEPLSPGLAARLYGPVLRTSVSRLEQFAECPFRFFVHSGLRAEERKRFELDVREQGTFQHDALALFHQQLRDQGKRWRDITPGEAREGMGRVARALMATYRDGLMKASDQTRFTAELLSESLQDFVEVLVGWVREQYRFDPVAVELAFGGEGGAPAWELDLGNGHRLALHGRMDRVDLCRLEDGAAACVVVDYKSSARQLDSVLVQHGVQLQLLAYLNVLRHWPNPEKTFAAATLVPAGVFYVNLRGKYGRESNRRAALDGAADARKLAYRHSGRFDALFLRELDSRPDARQGDQFGYRLRNDGQLHGGSREALPEGALSRLLDAVEASLKRMGREIFAGTAAVSPCRRGGLTACEYCEYRPVCRMDPWTHPFRLLRNDDQAGAGPAALGAEENGAA